MSADHPTIPGPEGPTAPPSDDAQTGGRARWPRRPSVVPCLAGLLLGIVIAGIVSLAVGSVPIPVGETVRVIADELPLVGSYVDASDVPEGRREIVLRIRPPRVALAILVGMSLALSGAIMQGFFRNPMADPYIVGVSPGAALGAVVAMTLGLGMPTQGWGLGVFALPLCAFVGALCVAFLVYGLARRGARVPTGTLLLTGVAVGALVSALTSFLLLYRSNDLRPVIQWLMGNLSGKQWIHVWMVCPCVLIGIPLALAQARELNVLLEGDEAALYMGVEVGRTRTSMLIVSVVLASAAVSAAGVVGFVGLIAPHITRLIVGPDHRRLLPLATLAGALLLVVADILCRVATRFDEIPVGLVTSVLGCPFFLYLLWRTRETRF